MCIAYLLADLGRIGEAFIWLDRAADDRLFALVFDIRTLSPAVIRADNRYEALLNRIGFPLVEATKMAAR